MLQGKDILTMAFIAKFTHIHTHAKKERSYAKAVTGNIVHRGHNQFNTSSNLRDNTTVEVSSWAENKVEENLFTIDDKWVKNERNRRECKRSNIEKMKLNGTDISQYGDEKSDLIYEKKSIVILISYPQHLLKGVQIHLCLVTRHNLFVLRLAKTRKIPKVRSCCLSVYLNYKYPAITYHLRDHLILALLELWVIFVPTQCLTSVIWF